MWKYFLGLAMAVLLFAPAPASAQLFRPRVVYYPVPVTTSYYVAPAPVVTSSYYYEPTIVRSSYYYAPPAPVVTSYYYPEAVYRSYYVAPVPRRIIVWP